MKSHILHTCEILEESVILELASLLKAKKIVKDEAVKFGKETNRWPHIYHFILE